MRAVPNVCMAYELEAPPAQLREVMRGKFKEHLGVTDAAVVDVLCYKGEQELQETLTMWKTKAHIQRYLDERASERPDFVTEFFESQEVEEWTWPPATEQRA